MYSYIKREQGNEDRNNLNPSLSNIVALTSSNADEPTKENTQNSNLTSDFIIRPRFGRKTGVRPIRPSAVSASNLNPTTPHSKPQNDIKIVQNEGERMNSNVVLKTPNTKFFRSESTPNLSVKTKDLMTSAAKDSAIKKSECTSEYSNQCTLRLLSGHSNSTNPYSKLNLQAPDEIGNQVSKTVHSEKDIGKWDFKISTKVQMEKNHSQMQPITPHHTGVVDSSSIFGEPKNLPLYLENNSQNLKSEEVLHCQDLPNFTTEPASVSKTMEIIAQRNTRPELPHTSSHIQCEKTLIPKENAFYSSSKAARLPSDKENVPTLSLTLNYTAKSSCKPEVSVPTITRKKSISTNLSAKFSAISPEIRESVLPPNPEGPVVKEVESRAANAPVANVLRQPSPQPAVPKRETFVVNGHTYIVMKQLGKGGSSVVYQVQNSSMTDVFALKVVHLDVVDDAIAESYLNEVELLKQLQGSPYVVKLIEYEHLQREAKLFLVMEKGDTDFSAIIKSHTKEQTLDPVLIRYYWQQMLRAVQSIHKKNVVHSDLKPANFLMVGGILKLIDFGIASSIQAEMTSILKDAQCGTYNYMAPESIKSTSMDAGEGYKISKRTDVWSLGCILYNLLYGKTPFQHISNALAKLNAIVDDKHQIHFPDIGDPKAVDVLKLCLSRNPKSRATIDELLLHPFLNVTRN